VNKLALLLRVLYEAETTAAEDLRTMSERHRSDHDIHHLTRDLARWSLEHIQLIADAAARAGIELTPDGDPPLETLALRRERMIEPSQSEQDPGLTLLRDLRTLHLNLIGLSVDWELLAQAAQGAKDEHLLDLATRCHPDTLRQARWANAKIKESAPQIMASR
jgi:hypothetical protein